MGSVTVRTLSDDAVRERRPNAEAPCPAASTVELGAQSFVVSGSGFGDSRL